MSSPGETNTPKKNNPAKGGDTLKKQNPSKKKAAPKKEVIKKEPAPTMADYPGPPTGPLKLPPGHEGKPAIEGETARHCSKEDGKLKPLSQFTAYTDGTYRAGCDPCCWITTMRSRWDRTGQWRKDPKEMSNQPEDEDDDDDDDDEVLDPEPL